MNKNRPKRRLWFKKMNNVAEKTPVPGPTDEQKTDARNLADTQVDSVICRDYNNEVFFLIICSIYHNHSEIIVIRVQVLSMDDISKMPRLPGDGAQDDTDSHFDESSNVAQLKSNQPSAKNSKNSLSEASQHTEQGLTLFGYYL